MYQVTLTPTKDEPTYVRTHIVHLSQSFISLIHGLALITAATFDFKKFLLDAYFVNK